jgi:hypothetical protein
MPLLLRAVGPGLERFRVSDPNLAPRLEIYRGTTLVAANEGWNQGNNNVAQITAATTVETTTGQK